MTRRWVATALTLVVIGVGVYLLATRNLHIPGLFPDTGTVEELEQEATEAGNQAEEGKREELEQETDEEVAADSRVADEHAADLVTRHAESVDAVRRAIDDLDRNLRADLHREAQERAGELSPDEHAESVRSAYGLFEHIDGLKWRIESFDHDLREELRRRVAQPDARTGEGVRPERDEGSF